MLVASLTNAAEKPNILLILCDDVGTGDFRVYNNRDTNPNGPLPPQLPQVEKLAEQGMRFTDANTPAALCAPNRYSLLSGNYVWRGRSPGGSWHFNTGSQFLEGQLSLADLLKKQGYRTAMFGKVHLGARVWPKGAGGDSEAAVNWDLRRPGGDFKTDETSFNYSEADFSRPLNRGVNSHGFDYSFTAYGGIQDPPYMWFENDRPYGASDPKNPSKDFVFHKGGRTQNENGTSEIWGWRAGYGMPYWKSNQVGIEMTEKAVAFIDRHVRTHSEQPFFIHFCSEAVHAPFTPPNQFLGREIQRASGDSAHADMLVQIDAMLTTLQDALIAHGLLENTLIILTSDNGGLPQSETKSRHESNRGLRENKAFVWEGGHRIPLIAKWSGRIAPGTSAPQLVALQDLYATIAELTGADIPAGQAQDSISFLNILTAKDPETALEIRTELAEHGIKEMETPGKYAMHHALRSGDLKLITDAGFTPRCLFNLKRDPKEENDLLHHPEYKHQVDQMLKRLKKLRNVQ